MDGLSFGNLLVLLEQRPTRLFLLLFSPVPAFPFMLWPASQFMTQLTLLLSDRHKKPAPTPALYYGFAFVDRLHMVCHGSNVY